ncbi:hypothetical protein [Streptomyces sp. NPDC058614]
MAADRVGHRLGHLHAELAENWTTENGGKIINIVMELLPQN